MFSVLQILIRLVRFDKKSTVFYTSRGRKMLYDCKNIHQTSLCDWLPRLTTKTSPQNRINDMAHFILDLHCWITSKRVALFCIRLLALASGFGVQVPLSVSVWLPTEEVIWPVPSRCAITGPGSSILGHCPHSLCINVLLDHRRCFLVLLCAEVLRFSVACWSVHQGITTRPGHGV